jgi:pimeloyl-ACP methyl ester carboxylesterase
MDAGFRRVNHQGDREMTTYVLVHGAWHGGWCWHRVAAHLERAAHRVIAPDLKSLGRDRSPPSQVSLADWAEQIASLARSEPHPVVLVGHSFGGTVISEVAERIPEHLRSLIYLTAFMLENGRSLAQAAADDPESLVGPATVVADDRLTAAIREDALRSTFYGYCSDADVLLAKSLLVPQATLPFATPVQVSDARFGRVPRVYIECSADRAITHAAQRRMQDRLPCRERITLDADHSPFLCRSEELAAVLQRY